MRRLFATAVFCLAASTAQGQTPPATQNEKPKDSQSDGPMHKAHSHDDSTSSAMNDRGEKGMGFSQTTATHHFLLSTDGGVIQVEANHPTDAATRDSIRMYLTHIATAFASGDFAIPMFVHATAPPGVPVMK